MITPDILLLCGMLLCFCIGLILVSDSKDGSMQRGIGVSLAMIGLGFGIGLGYYLGVH